MMKTLLELHPANDERKLIRLIQGDIMDETGSFDLLICSAYKNRYWVTDRSLIGSLFWERNISIDLLSRSPALNMKDQGFWISDEIDSNFRRIGCIELLDPDHREDSSLTILKSKYAAMRYLLEQASYMGIPVSNIAMTVFGTGEQQIELQYMACVLWEQLTLALQSIDALTEINIYERDPEKASLLESLLRQIVLPEEGKPGIFISYSSKQFSEAESIKNVIEQNGYRCWMAPNSIPAGSSYIKEIPRALSNADIIVLILTPDAERSEWVPKEIGTAMGMRKKVIPFRREVYDLGLDFLFLLNNVQIIPFPGEAADYSLIVKEIRNYYDRENSNE